MLVSRQDLIFSRFVLSISAVLLQSFHALTKLLKASTAAVAGIGIPLTKPGDLLGRFLIIMDFSD